MKKLLFLAFALLSLSGLSAEPTDSKQEQQQPAKQEEKKCFFGRCNKSKAFSEEHYQTGAFSATRMWLALLLGYEVDQEGKNKALQIAANRGDDKKVKILTSYGANPQEALALTTRNGFFKTSKILVEKGAQVQPKELKALQECFLGCYMGQSEKTQEHLQKFNQCREVAGLFNVALAKSNEGYTKEKAKQDELRTKYAAKLAAADKKAADFAESIKYNKAYQGNLEVLNKDINSRLIETFDAMRVKVAPRVAQNTETKTSFDRTAEVFLQGLNNEQNFC